MFARNHWKIDVIECSEHTVVSGPEEAQGLQRFWPLHHLSFKFFNLTCHVMCSLHELLCIL